jgi:hypothetical protein
MPSPVTPDKGSMPPPPPPATTASVEYKKDGTISRMRSHRGNVPQLPQTKLCPFCPAKFTRTTHLNRHLRNRRPTSLWVLSANSWIDYTRRYERAFVSMRGAQPMLPVDFPMPNCVVLGQVCGAQFTRSDLLARHKRSCGES